jgi:GNAT superfamily N-acetyltransferase
MEVERFEEAATFRDLVGPFLLQHESANNLIVGVTETAVTRPDIYEGFTGWAVIDDDEVVAVAAQTSPHNLILAEAVSEQAVRLLARETGDLPGVIGTRPWIDLFIEERPEAAGRTMSQGIFELDEVVQPKPAPGLSRPATTHHRETLAEWVAAFQIEAAGLATPRDSERIVDLRLEGPPERFGFWVHEVDDTPVAMTGNTGPTPNGIRIGPVYTPPEHRGKGYASNLVATQSQWLLDSGRRFCFLYTDLANPISNSIYQRIGYRQVAESAEYSFNHPE